MKDFRVTCICGEVHQMDEGENSICSCGTALKIAGAGLGKVKPVATIPEDSLAKHIAAGHVVKQPHPSIRATRR